MPSYHSLQSILAVENYFLTKLRRRRASVVLQLQADTTKPRIQHDSLSFSFRDSDKMSIEQAAKHVSISFLKMADCMPCFGVRVSFQKVSPNFRIAAAVRTVNLN